MKWLIKLFSLPVPDYTTPAIEHVDTRLYHLREVDHKEAVRRACRCLRLVWHKLTPNDHLIVMMCEEWSRGEPITLSELYYRAQSVNPYLSSCTIYLVWFTTRAEGVCGVVTGVCSFASTLTQHMSLYKQCEEIIDGPQNVPKRDGQYAGTPETDVERGRDRRDHHDGSRSSVQGCSPAPNESCRV